MAKKRRSYQINSGDYNIAGGGGAVSGTVRYMQKDTTAVASGGQGVLYKTGTKNVPNPIKLNVEAGLQVTTATQTESLVYFEHAFEAPNAQVALVSAADELPTGYTSNLPSGLSVNTQLDQGDGNYGYVQFSTNTISSSAPTGVYKFRYKVDQGGWTRSYIDYEVDVWPSGTTPTFSNTSLLLTRIIKGTASKQYLTDAVTGSQIVGFSLANVSGFPTGYELKVEGADAGANAGRAYVENTPDTSHASAAHSFDIVVDLGQYGNYTQSFSGNITYGDAYGSRYFGPANSYRNWSNGDYENDSDPTKADGTYWFSPNQNSGALRCDQRNRDSSPYGQSDGYGCGYSFSGTAGTSSITSTAGNMYSYTNNWYTSGNDGGIRFKWTVPNGVTEFCVAGISGGCHGGASWANDGGGAGALAYVNAVTCTAGEEFLIRVGMGRSVTGQSSYWAGDTYMQRMSNNEYIFYCYGAGYHSRQGNISIGSWSKYTHSNNQTNPGAAAASSNYGSYAAYYGGWSTSYSHGGGTAGWRGTGDGGSNGGSSNNGGARNGRGYSSTYGGSAGGGTGLDGNGVGVQAFGYSYGSADAQSDTNTQYGVGSHGWRYGGGGGSGGVRGTYGENPYTGSGYSSQAIQGGMHGGGGGGAGTSWGSGPGAPGGIRIIWGSGRAFPNTYTTENPSINGQS